MKYGTNRGLSLLLIVVSLPASYATADITNTKHNLAVSGPGTVKASSETEICIFCHSPHTSSSVMPLWNRTLPNLVYIPYSSSTLQSTPGQPTHASKLCLSCHDGTIALGSLESRSSPVSMTGVLSDRANLTTDLSDDHPISFVYDATVAAQDTQLLDPSMLTGVVKLDSHGQMQCTTCHDPHSDVYSMFLVTDNAYSTLCTACHKRNGWTGSSHALSNATWNGAGIDPWPHTNFSTVASNGCESCHAPHAAGFPETLLTQATEEESCLVCHNANVATTNIQADIQKTYRHPVGNTFGVHDPVEDYYTMSRHVECQDCHNPHAANNNISVAPNITGALEGVSGVSIGGTFIDSAQYEYEVCFKCHADNSNVPAPEILRQIYQPNIRMKFNPANPSFHPVASVGVNNDVPSLKPEWTESSRVYCSDCHASDTGQGAGGSGPAGPHGSNWQFLLERRYSITDNLREQASLYDLCYKCHSRNSILGDVSFSKHRKHLQSENASCSVCHDPHGISATQGNSTNNSHLINFDTSIVQPSSSGQLKFIDLGNRRGRCYLTCHGKNHNPKSYPGHGNM